MNKDYYDINKLKAIEICVSKGVNIGYLKDCEDYEEYLNEFNDNQGEGNLPSFDLLTQEEFNIVKKTTNEFRNEIQERRTRIKRYRYMCGIDLNNAFDKAFNEAFNKAINEAIEEIKKRNLKQ